MWLPRLVRSRLSFRLGILAALTVSPNARATQLRLSATDLHFGNVRVGQSRSLSATVTNIGERAVKISSIRSSAKVFVVPKLKLPVTLQAGHLLVLHIGFRPLEAGQVHARILFNETDASLRVQGWGLRTPEPPKAALKATPPSLTFGSVHVGESAKLPIALTNTGTSPVSIPNSGLRGAGFTVVGLSPALTLKAGQSFTFAVEFVPKTSGRVSGELTFAQREHAALLIPLRATGTSAGNLSYVPAAMNFGNVTVGKSATSSGTLTATGGSVRIHSVISSSPEFVVTGISLPMTIAAGQRVHYTVTFRPQQSGTASASLSFASSASDSEVSESLTGGGVVPTESVRLSWDASTSQVLGYNVYRGSQQGGPYARINAGIDPAITYTDDSVIPGSTYFYVITAVNSSGRESKYSNPAKALIPSQ